MTRVTRLEHLRQALHTRQLDGLLVSQPESRYYLSGYTGHDLPPRDSAGYLLISPQTAFLLTDGRTSQQAESEAPDFEVVRYPTGVQGPETITQVAKANGLRRLAFEAVHLPFAV